MTVENNIVSISNNFCFTYIVCKSTFIDIFFLFACIRLESIFFLCLSLVGVYFSPYFCFCVRSVESFRIPYAIIDHQATD